jgi:hypothetical protein
MARRSFRVTGVSERAGRFVLTLMRTSRIALEGEGDQSGERVRITGSGVGEHTYTLDPSVGELLSARGTSTLDLTLQSRLRTQRVRQAADIRIDRAA